MKRFAYLTLFTKNLDGKFEYLIGLKKFLNLKDGYIGTNPNQYVIPGGNMMENEDEKSCAVREFEEETGFNLFDLGCESIKEIYSNKYANFFLAEIPYYNKKNFKYSKSQIIKNGNFPEFIKFKWVNLSDAIIYFKRKPKLEYLINVYLEHKNKFLGISKPSYLSSEMHLNLLNDNNMNTTIIFLKKYISKRLDNDWFINMFKNMKKMKNYNF